MCFFNLFSTIVDGLKVSGEQASGLCPFHEDSRSSFSCNLVTGVWICFAGCGSGNIYQFADRLGIDQSIINGRNDISVNPKRKREAEIVPELSNQRKREALKFHNYFIENWHKIKKPMPWSIDVIKQTYTGYDQKLGRFTFIYLNQLGRAINIRWHKLFSVRGHGSCTFYPLHLLEDFNSLKPLLLCEGEKDTITAMSLGFQAATATNGANSIPKDLNPIRNFKNIYVLYDNDETGKIGAKNIALAIKSNFPKINVKITNWRTL